MHKSGPTGAHLSALTVFLSLPLSFYFLNDGYEQKIREGFLEKLGSEDGYTGPVGEPETTV